MKQWQRLFVVAATLVFALSVQANDDRVYRLKLASSWGSTVPVLGEAPEELKSLVETMSNGRLQLRIDDPAKHKAGVAVMDFVKAGQYDIGYTASYYYKGKDAKLIFFTTVPFGLLPNEQHAWFEFGGGKELAKRVYDEHGLLHFQGGNTGMQMGGWFKKEINSLEDLKGLKVRIPGMGGEVMSKTGVLVTSTPVGELYLALEMGQIDGVEWISPVFDLNMGFQKVAKYYYTGWQEPASETQYLVNSKAFNKLPEDLQVILETAIQKVASRVMSKAMHLNTEAWDKMSSEYPDVTVASFPDEVLSAFKEANAQILEEEAAKDPLFKEILDSQRAFIGKARAWTKMGDYAYINNTSK
jgi:TRAP-type mannitol/chloroaromatic compound transport system substrate-binding protein